MNRRNVVDDYNLDSSYDEDETVTPTVNPSLLAFESALNGWDDLETIKSQKYHADEEIKVWADKEGEESVSDASISDTDSDSDFQVKVLEIANNLVRKLSYSSSNNPSYPVNHQTMSMSRPAFDKEGRKGSLAEFHVVSSEDEYEHVGDDVGSEYNPRCDQQMDKRHSLPIRKRKHGIITLVLSPQSSISSQSNNFQMQSNLDLDSLVPSIEPNSNSPVEGILQTSQPQISRKQISNFHSSSSSSFLTSPPKPPRKQTKTPSRTCANPNCRTTEASAWRFLSTDTYRETAYCSPCKLYHDANKKHRPRELVLQPRKVMRLKSIPDLMRKCKNCSTENTPLWRFVRGELYCNACAQYYNKHQRDKPLRSRQDDFMED